FLKPQAKIGALRWRLAGKAQPAEFAHTTAVAIAARPSPRPVKPMWSVVVAEIDAGAPRISLKTRWASSRRGPILGVCAINWAAALPMVKPLASSNSLHSRSKRSPETLSYSLRPTPTNEPRSPRLEADRRASTSACDTTSPSEWPSQPASPSKRNPAIQHSLPSSIWWASKAVPTRGIIGWEVMGTFLGLIVGEQGISQGQVNGSGDFKRHRITVDRDHGLAEPFHQAGIIGCDKRALLAGEILFIGRAQSGKVEGLRGLHRAQCGAVWGI